MDSIAMLQEVPKLSWSEEKFLHTSSIQTQCLCLEPWTMKWKAYLTFQNVRMYPYHLFLDWSDPTETLFLLKFFIFHQNTKSYHIHLHLPLSE